MLDSPFHEHLGTNYVPTDAEIEQIRTHLLPHEAELARLEILLEILIQDLTTQRDRVREYIEPHKALISHPRRLPQDVVEGIFLACLPTSYYAVMSPATAPLLLGRICSAWRSIAFAMPSLWASLHIVFDFVVSNEERKAAFVDWLKRSGQLPLAISSTFVTRHHKAMSSVMDLLIPLAPRWRTLQIFKMDVSDFVQLGAVNAPRLANVRLVFKDEFTTKDGPRLLASNLFRGGNSVITIITPNPWALVPQSSFTWDHITHLTLQCREGSRRWQSRGLDFETVCRLLKGCSHLRSLEFPFESSPWDELDEPLLLPFLESLIVVNEYSDANAFVKQLMMPQLDRFHLVALPPIQLADDTVLLEHLARHSPLITELGIGIFDFARPSLIATLQLFPSIRKLSLLLWYSCSDEPWWPKANAVDLLTLLTPTGSQPNLLPALTELDTGGEPFPDEIWVNFLQKHLEHGTKLQRLGLGVHCHPPKDMPDLRPFLSRGLEVSLQYKSILDNRQRPTPWHGIEGHPF
ncbi:hypothetical protein DFH06DRAFT_1473336 [Mycena polygramma]|nr:hypothetical protein DFH06DRAFT_1473336 [Mycena polygramma]